MSSNRDLLLSLSELLDEQGKPVEAGWIKVRACLREPSAEQAALARFYFMSGALHLFRHICDLDDQSRDGEQFNDRMCRVRDELQDFARSVLAHDSVVTKGNA
jgi:hypothetical protein